MNDNKNMKNKVWIYAVILFTSAFIVLLITAVSQIKLNQNIVDFKSQISNKEDEKNKVQLSYAKALETVDLLTEENEKLTEDNVAVKDELYNVKQSAAEREATFAKQKEQYEKLSKAQAENIAGNLRESADLLKSIDRSQLGTEGVALYEAISADIFDKAGEYCFESGYEAYSNGEYEEAANNLSLSREYITTADYSAKCLYYLAYAEYKLDNKAKALEYMKLLIEEYPDSSYKNKARTFIDKHGE